MGLKIDNSPVDARLSKMEAAIENIASLATIAKLAVNQLMEREAVVVVTSLQRMKNVRSQGFHKD
jgi:hypothetical protein